MDQPLHCYAYPSPLGVITLGIRAGALALLDLPGEARPSVDAEELCTEPLPEEAELLEHVGQQLADYFAGSRQHFDLPLAPEGTPFQREVWAELARVPYGQTLSYLQLAQRLGKPAWGAILSPSSCPVIALSPVVAASAASVRASRRSAGSCSWKVCLPLSSSSPVAIPALA